MKHKGFVVFVIVLLCSALTALPVEAAEAGGWTSWWLNAEQRGEKLLQEGDAAAAARTFTDPQRKAYAKLLAGDYQHAAQELSAFDDGDAHYNRGNALAHAGKLQDALQAYDLALKRDPKNQDAPHNRDLVAKALEQKPPEQQGAGAGQKNPQDAKSPDKQGSGQGDSSPAPGQKGKADAPPGKNPNDEGENSERPSARDSVQPGNEQSSAKQPEKPSASSPATNATPSEMAEKSKPRSAADEQAASDRSAKDKQAPGGVGEKQGQTQQGAQVQAQKADDAEQARHDAAAGLAQPPAGQAGAAASGKDLEARREVPAAKARASEQQLAQEQWLRSIPDDPGGLLRRKFLVEHLQRQQKSQP